MSNKLRRTVARQRELASTDMAGAAQELFDLYQEFNKAISALEAMRSRWLHLQDQFDSASHWLKLTDAEIAADLEKAGYDTGQYATG